MKNILSVGLLFIATLSTAQAGSLARYKIPASGKIQQFCSSSEGREESRMNAKFESSSRMIWLHGQAKVCTIIGFKEFFMELPLVIPSENEVRNVQLHNVAGRISPNVGITQVEIRRSKNPRCALQLDLSYLSANGTPLMNAHVCSRFSTISTARPPGIVSLHFLQKGIAIKAQFDRMKEE